MSSKGARLGEEMTRTGLLQPIQVVRNGVTVGHGWIVFNHRGQMEHTMADDDGNPLPRDFYQLNMIGIPQIVVLNRTKQ